MSLWHSGAHYGTGYGHGNLTEPIRRLKVWTITCSFGKIIITGKEEFPYSSDACIHCMEIDFRRIYRDVDVVHGFLILLLALKWIIYAMIAYLQD